MKITNSTITILLVCVVVFFLPISPFVKLILAVGALAIAIRSVIRARKESR